MVWPFSKSKTRSGYKMTFTAEAFFDHECKFGDSKIEPGKGVVAIVIDAAKEFGVATPIKIESDGHQLAMLRVASDDGGFVVPARTPSGGGPKLSVNDLVIWVPELFREEIASMANDPRFGWIGFIRAKISPEYDVPSYELNILCRYD